MPSFLTRARDAFRSFTSPKGPEPSKALTREFVDDEDYWQVTGAESIAAHLTPTRLAQVWRDADNGDPRAYLTLAYEIERRDLHYLAAISQRRTVVSQIEPEVTPVDDSAKQQEIAADVRRLVTDPAFSRLLFHSLDAVPKGYSFVETLWDTSSGQWWPKRYEWRDQRLFRVDPVTLRGYRYDDQSQDGVELPEHKFIVHESMLMSGAPVQSGLARVCSPAYLCKSYTVRDLMRFLEVYGIPARVGKYPTGSPKEFRSRLFRAVQQLGTDAAAVIPSDMSVEFMDSQRGNESKAFLGAAEFWNREISKAILGQTSSVEGGAGDYKASLTHKGVRLDIAAHDARQLMVTIAEQLIQPFVAFNHGPQACYPMVRLPVPVPEDLTKFAAAVTPFVDRGLAVAARSVYTKLGLPEPQEDDKLLEKRVVSAGGEAPSGDAPGQTDFDADSPEDDDESSDS